MKTIPIDMMLSLLIAVLVLLGGKFLQSKIKFLQRFFIPAPVIGGTIFSIFTATAYYCKWFEFQFDNSTENLFMVAFFTTIGFSASLKFLKRGGKLVFLFLICAVGLVICQDVVGVGLALALRQSPLIGLLTASIPMTGGHGTAAAFGAQIAKEFGLPSAPEIGIAAATFGLIAGSVIGGPVGKKLLTKYHLKLSPEEIKKAREDAREAAGEDWHSTEEEMNITETGIFNAVAIISIAIGIGQIVSMGVKATGIIVPGYIGAMLVAAIIRNITDHWGKFKLSFNELQVIGGISLELFLAMALMEMKLWLLSSLALPMMIMLAGQVVLMIFYAYFITFRIMGRDYDAAVISCGHCGFGLGATPNAVANMEAFTEKNYPSPTSFFVLPLVGALFIDFMNSAVITVFLGIIKATSK